MRQSLIPFITMIQSLHLSNNSIYVYTTSGDEPILFSTEMYVFLTQKMISLFLATKMRARIRICSNCCIVQQVIVGMEWNSLSMIQRDHSMRKTSRIIVQDGTVTQTISPVKRTVSTLENDRSMCILLGIDVEIVAESQLSAIPSISSTSEKERERLRRTMKNQMENKVCCSICMEMCRSCQRNCHLR